MTDTARSRRRKSRRTFGSIEKLPSGRYRASYKAPDGRRRFGSHLFASVADADAWLSTISAQITRGDWRPPEPARESFGAFARKWIDLRVGRNGVPLSPTTAEAYVSLWHRWLEPSFADIALGDITTETVRTWLAKARTDHLGSSQPEKAYRLLRTILNVAVDDEKIRVNPCRIKGAGKENSEERPVADPEAVLRIAAAIEPQYRAMVILGAWCSLRLGELAGLRRGRYDQLHRKLLIVEQGVELRSGEVVFKEPKWDSRRDVDLSPELVELLDEHLARYVGTSADALLFTSPEGHPLRRRKFRFNWARACRAAGVTGLHFHDLRGSGATWRAHQGATLAELMQVLGHRTHVAALRYQHATNERGQAMAERLGALMRAVETTQESGENVHEITS